MAPHENLWERYARILGTRYYSLNSQNSSCPTPKQADQGDEPSNSDSAPLRLLFAGSESERGINSATSPSFRSRIKQKRGRSRRPFLIRMFGNQLGVG